MSSQKESLKKKIFKKSMFAASALSTAALMLSGGSAFGAPAALVNSTTTAATNLSTGLGFDVPGPFANGSAITVVNKAHTITLDGPTPWQIASIYLPDGSDGVIINCNVDSTFGSINNVNGNGADIQKVNFVIADGVNETLTGAGITQPVAAGALDANGAASPFADSNAVPADTYYINNIDFANGAGALNISDPTITNSIKLNANTYSTTLENAAAATLNVNSGLTVRDITWATLKTINIANGVKYEYITNDANDIDVQPTLNQLIFKGANSAVNFSNENINSNKFVATEGIVSGADDQGIVSFHVSTSATEISANVGTNAKRLQAFITDGLNITTITGNIFAKKIAIAQNPQDLPNQTQLIWTTPINTGGGGLVQFTTNSISQFQDDITSNMDFNGTDATAILDNDVDVTGNIINSVAGGTGTINFADNSTVTGNVGGLNGIGGNTTGSYPVGVFNIQGDNATTVDLQGNVTVNNFNFTSNGIASIGGTLTATAGVNYNNAAGTLQFNGAAGPYTFNSPIVNGNNGTLDVFTNLLATNANIGTLATINIGNNIGGNGSLTVTVPGDVAFNSPININTAVSQLIIAPGAAQTFTFGNNVTNTKGVQGGSVTFDGTGGGLVVAGNAVIGATNNLNAIL
nr:hypothetical protein [Rickettsia endosymbiont of Ceutorhynchus assimilis]